MKAQGTRLGRRVMTMRSDGTRPPCVRSVAFAAPVMAVATSRAHVPWYSIMPCIRRMAIVTQAQERAAPLHLQQAATPLHSLSSFLSVVSSGPRNSSGYAYLIPRATYLLHVTRIGDVPHCRLVLVTSNLDRLSCRTHTRNSLVAVSRRVTRGRQRLAVAVPDEALRSACVRSCYWWNAHHGYALCYGVPLSRW
jgi:hypothetical protein